MTISVQRLFQPTQVPAIAGLIYTATAAVRIDKLTVANPSSTTASVLTVYWVPAGSAAGATNVIAASRTLQPYDSWDVWPFMGHVLANGDAIWAVATGAALNIFGSGTVVQ